MYRCDRAAVEIIRWPLAHPTLTSRGKGRGPPTLLPVSSASLGRRSRLVLLRAVEGNRSGMVVKALYTTPLLPLQVLPTYSA